MTSYEVTWRYRGDEQPSTQRFEQQWAADRFLYFDLPTALREVTEATLYRVVEEHQKLAGWEVGGPF